MKKRVPVGLAGLIRMLKVPGKEKLEAGLLGCGWGENVRYLSRNHTQRMLREKWY